MKAKAFKGIWEEKPGYNHIPRNLNPKRSQEKIITGKEEIKETLRTYEPNDLPCNFLSTDGVCLHYFNKNDLDCIVSSFTIQKYMDGISNKVTLYNLPYTMMSNKEINANADNVKTLIEIGQKLY